MAQSGIDMGKAFVQIVPSAQGIAGSIAGLIGPEAASAGESAGASIGGKIISGIKKVAAVAAVGKFFKDSLLAGGELEQSIGGIETLFKESSDAVLANAQVASKTAGISANEYMQQATSFSASLLSSLEGDTAKAAAATDTAIKDMADNANKMGTPLESIQNAYQGFAKQQYNMLDNLKLGYGGTKSEMERLLKDASELSGVEYNIDNLADVYEAIHVIQEDLDIFGTTAKEAEGTLQGSFAMMKANAENFLGSIALGRETAAKDLVELASSVVSVAKNVGRMVLNIIKTLPQALIIAIPQIFNNIVSMIQTEGPKLYESITSLLTTAITTIQTNLPIWLEKGKELLTNIITGIQQNVPMVLENILNMLSQLLTTIQTNLPLWIEKGKELLSNILTGIGQFLPQLIQGILNVLTSLLTTIVSRMPEFLQKGVSILMNLTTGIWSYMPTLISKVFEILANVVSTITGYLPKLLTLGLDLISNLATGIWNNKGRVIQYVKDIGSSILSSLGSLMTGMFNVGANLIKGLWNGIKSVKDWIVGKIKGFTGSILNSIKGFFGIHSPSRVFRDEVGAMLGQGMALGIEDEVSTVSKAMDKLQNATVRDMNSVLGIDTYTNASVRSGFAGSTLNAYLSMGEKTYRLMVQDFTNEQSRQTELGLAY